MIHFGLEQYLPFALYISMFVTYVASIRHPKERLDRCTEYRAAAGDGVVGAARATASVPGGTEQEMVGQ